VRKLTTASAFFLPISSTNFPNGSLNKESVLGMKLASVNIWHLGTAVMKHFYKDHRIEVSVWLDGDEWFVGLYIYYQVERTNTLVTFSLEGKFTTYDEAVKAGLEAAQRWIDKYKPNLNT
jgi:hypothetical protein